MHKIFFISLIFISSLVYSQRLATSALIDTVKYKFKIEKTLDCVDTKLIDDLLFYIKMGVVSDEYLNNLSPITTVRLVKDNVDYVNRPDIFLLFINTILRNYNIFSLKLGCNRVDDWVISYELQILFFDDSGIEYFMVFRFIGEFGIIKQIYIY